jgi:hypothetical protein
MVISSCKHNYKIVLLCKGEFCASISIEEIKKIPRFERSFLFQWHKICHFYHLFSNWMYLFYFFFFSGCKLCMLKTKYLEKHNKRQNVTWAHSFLLFAQKRLHDLASLVDILTSHLALTKTFGGGTNLKNNS